MRGRVILTETLSALAGFGWVGTPPENHEQLVARVPRSVAREVDADVRSAGLGAGDLAWSSRRAALCATRSSTVATRSSRCRAGLPDRTRSPSNDGWDTAPSPSRWTATARTKAKSPVTCGTVRARGGIRTDDLTLTSRIERDIHNPPRTKSPAQTGCRDRSGPPRTTPDVGWMWDGCGMTRRCRAFVAARRHPIATTVQGSLSAYNWMCRSVYATTCRFLYGSMCRSPGEIHQLMTG
jgi:hypothetical protein